MLTFPASPYCRFVRTNYNAGFACVLTPIHCIYVYVSVYLHLLICLYSEPSEKEVTKISSKKTENMKMEPSESANVVESSVSESKVVTETKGPVSSLPEKEKGMSAVAGEITQMEDSAKQPSCKYKEDEREEQEGDSKKQQDTEDEEGRKARIEHEIFELNDKLSEAASAVNLKPLGSDRYHRNYWVFPTLPGLYVEDSGEFWPTETDPQQQTEKVEKCHSPKKSEVKPQPTPLFPPPPLASAPSDKEAIVDLTKESPEEQTFPKPPPLIPISETVSVVQEQEKRTSISNTSVVSTASSVCTPKDKTTIEEHGASLLEEIATIHVSYVHSRGESQPMWYLYRSQDEVDGLLDSLNPRGLRELELKRIIGEQRVHFEPHLSKCPFQSTDTPPSASLPYPKYNSADQYLELYLREQILDIEEKIHLGSLGYLREVEERARWRDSIENSGAAAALDPNAPIQEEAQQEQDALSASKASEDGCGRSRSTTPIVHEDGSRRKSSPPVNPSVHELSRALLQVQAGIEKKYLMAPLGMAVDQKKRRRQKEQKVIKESDVCVEEWRASLARASSFSQVFVHLATLERCVMWSKSLMNVRCRICRRKCGDEFMLLCDGCDHGYHTYCLKPPLKDVPDGDWFCYDCNPMTPVKPRRRVQRVVIVEESSESEQEEEDQASEEEQDGSDEEVEEEEADDEEESEEEEPPTSRRYLRYTHSRSADVVVSSRTKGSRGRASSRLNNKNKKQAKGKGKLSKTRLEKVKKPEVGGKRPRGRPPGRPRVRSSPSLQTFNSSSSTPESSSNFSRPSRKKIKQDNSSYTPDNNSNSRGNGPSARKKLKLDQIPSPAYQSKAEGVIASIIELRCTGSRNRSHSSAFRREQESLESQLREALWEDINDQEEGVHFEAPVKKREVSSVVLLF